MGDCSELNTIRKKLVKALGDSAPLYFQQMKLWFQMKCTKEEFDSDSRKLMTGKHIHLHNEFMLCLFNKCQSLAFTQPSYRNEPGAGKKIKTKKKIRSEKYFEPVDVADYISPVYSPPPQAYEEPVRYCAQELFLPDTSLIFGRLLLAAWDRGLEGVDETAAEYLVAAVQVLLKNVLTAVLSRKNGYKLRDGCFMYGMGGTVPNPWLRNTVKVMNCNKVTRVDVEDGSDVEDPLEEEIKTPTLEEVEQRAAYEIACGCDDIVKIPVTPYHIFQTLLMYPHLIPSNTVYNVYLEKVVNRLRHPTPEELEAPY